MVTSPCASDLPAGSPPLMAVLEGQNRSGLHRSEGHHDKVVVAGLDAIGRARAAFQPRFSPYMDGQWLAPYEAYVVRGTVYYIDAYGTVFRIGLDGKQAVVTKFPITINVSTQPGHASYVAQEVSFAVSPDGCQLAATVLTMPPPDAAGQWTLQTMKATAGSPAEVLHTGTSYLSPSSQGAFENLVLVGWDSVGPIVVVGSDLSMTANPTINFDFSGGTVAHLSGDGNYRARVEPPTCKAVQVSPRGDVTCYEPRSGETFRLGVVRSTGGTELAPVDVAIPSGYAYVAVGPNGLVALAVGVLGGAPGQWRGPDGSGGTLPAGFYPEGWVDSQTIFGRVGQMPPGDATLVRIGGPQPTSEDLGFQGDFVGMLGG